MAMEDNFARIVGRAATPDEVARLYRIRDAIGLNGDDPFWMILYALEYYKVLYESIPAKIEQVFARIERLPAPELASVLPSVDSMSELVDSEPAAAQDRAAEVFEAIEPLRAQIEVLVQELESRFDALESGLGQSVDALTDGEFEKGMAMLDVLIAGRAEQQMAAIKGVDAKLDQLTRAHTQLAAGLKKVIAIVDRPPPPPPKSMPAWVLPATLAAGTVLGAIIGKLL